MNEQGEDDFSGEVLTQSLDSLDEFFLVVRELMKCYPVGRLREREHLGFFMMQMLNLLIRPFLDTWQSRIRTFCNWQEAPVDPDENRMAFPFYEMLTQTPT